MENHTGSSCKRYQTALLPTEYMLIGIVTVFVIIFKIYSLKETLSLWRLSLLQKYILNYFDYNLKLITITFLIIKKNFSK